MPLRIKILFYALIAAAIFSMGTYLGATLAKCTREPTAGAIDNVLYDINNDDKIDCKDKALIFYDMARAHGMQPRIIYGQNVTGDDSHMWIRINGVDIEPFAYKSNYWRPDPYRYVLLDLTAYYNAIVDRTIDWTRLTSYERAIRLDK